MNDKVLIALLSILVGWVLAQGTVAVKEWWTKRKHLKGLEDELEDLKPQLKRLLLIYQRKIQFYAIMGVETSVPVSINNYYFKHFYKDVFSSLNRDQRISYQLIHSSIDAFNQGNQDLIRLIKDNLKDHHESSNDPALKEAVLRIGDAVIALYKNV